MVCLKALSLCYNLIIKQHLFIVNTFFKNFVA
nr:MAG TPA: hypothetical protein [Caudoviricetes sp.]